MSSPTQRALDHLRRLGYLAVVVERWNQYGGADRRVCNACRKPLGPGIRVDFLGFLDILGIRSDQPGVLGIQVTSRTNLVARVAKITTSDVLFSRLRVWLEAGNSAECWGYALRGARGARKLYELDRWCFVLREDGEIAIRRAGAELPPVSPIPHARPALDLEADPITMTAEELAAREKAAPLFAPVRQRILG